MTSSNEQLVPVEQLKPCQCGGRAILYVRDFTDDQANVGEAYVECLGCGIEQPFRKTAELAIAAWNTRTPPAQHPGWTERGKQWLADGASCSAT